MNTLFMNCENSKTSDPHRFSINLPDKKKWKRMINMLLYQILTSAIHENVSKVL